MTKKEYPNTCKFGECQQPSELTSDKSIINKYCTKNEKGKEISYILHAHPAVKVNGYCRYHNWFEDRNTVKKR